MLQRLLDEGTAAGALSGVCGGSDANVDGNGNVKTANAKVNVNGDVNGGVYVDCDGDENKENEDPAEAGLRQKKDGNADDGDTVDDGVSVGGGVCGGVGVGGGGDGKKHTEMVRVIVDGVCERMSSLMTDQFGNYLCQKVIDVCFADETDKGAIKRILTRVADSLVGSASALVTFICFHLCSLMSCSWGSASAFVTFSWGFLCTLRTQISLSINMQLHFYRWRCR
jgi:hypothetical protein